MFLFKDINIFGILSFPVTVWEKGSPYAPDCHDLLQYLGSVFTTRLNRIFTGKLSVAEGMRQIPQISLKSAKRECTHVYK